MMKILAITLIVLLLSILNLLFMDFLLGFDFSESVLHLLNPFWVISSAEYVMLAGLFLLVIGQQIYTIVKKRTNKQDESN
ncbi:hypothetical protein [Priestia endophytica]|uniref:hypothetical protein n=1 Tax=Priestia endophytica TaxID=135735 RepID=UPI00227EBAFF|nr:hypothetical protein [Priestia endophytica]MCY8231156.1 hypothetical protein [Priestia endophytica]